MNRKELLRRCGRIKIVITDVDCVLTDGGMYYSDKGDVMKKFHTRDGMGVTLLRKNNIPTILVTKESTKIVKQWATKMKVEKLYDGIQKKELVLKKICTKYKTKPNNLAYIGDDVNDMGLLKLVGLSVTPSDGINEVKEMCHYVCKAKGGFGAFRELADLILNNSKKIK